jgi:hypothetical protein
MSSRYLSAIWVGIQQKVPGKLTESHGIYDEKMIGVVVRSAYCRPLGHFMYCRVSINGRKMWAGGAEDGIFPFHHITLALGEQPPKDMVPALGFCRSGNGYAFNYKGRPCVITKPAVRGMEEGFEPVAESEIPDEWRTA